MIDSSEARCCGHLMSRIAVEQAGAALELHSCASCGRHAWQSGGRPVDRTEVLQALQVAPRQDRTAEGSRAAVPADPDEQRRADLKRLLSDFTVHGSSS